MVSDALCVRGRAHFDEMQASGLAAVLLQPGQRLLLHIDVTYLLPLQDKVRSQALERTTARAPARSKRPRTADALLTYMC